MNQTITFDGGPMLHIKQEQIDIPSGPGGIPQTAPGPISATIAGTTRGMYVVLPVNADIEKRILEATSGDADEEQTSLRVWVSAGVDSFVPFGGDRDHFQRVLQEILDDAQFESFSSVANPPMTGSDRVEQLEAIVRALAEREPYDYGHGCCPLCGDGDPEDHAEACPWRQAVEWTQQQDGHTP